MPIVILAVVLAALCIIFLITTYITYRIAYYQNPNIPITPDRHINSPVCDGHREKVLAMIDEVSSMKYENVYITASDGVRLRARYYHVKDGAPVALQLHGYRSTPMLDFSGGGPLAARLGFNIIMVDQRAHGESGGRTITFGDKEKSDCLLWIKYILERFGADTKIVLYGVSMGAATVILASELDLPANVLGGFCDCPYSSAREMIRKTIREMHLPVGIFYPIVRLGAKIWGGFDPDRAEPLAAAGRAKIPLVIVHGEDDSFVPCDMSREMAKAAPDRITLHTFPLANHAMSYVLDTERYHKIVGDFLSSLFEKENL